VVLRSSFSGGLDNTNDVFIWSTDVDADQTSNPRPNGQIYAFQLPVEEGDRLEVTFLTSNDQVFHSGLPPVITNSGRNLYWAQTRSEVRCWAGGRAFDEDPFFPAFLQPGDPVWSTARAPPTVTAGATPAVYGPSAANEIYRLNWDCSLSPESDVYSFADNSTVVSSRVVLSADEKYLYVGTQQGDLHFFDTTDLAAGPLWTYPVGGGIAGDMALSPDGTQLYTADVNGNVRAFRVKEIFTMPPAPSPSRSSTNQPVPTAPVNVSRERMVVEGVTVEFTSSQIIPEENVPIFQDIVATWFNTNYNGGPRRSRARSLQVAGIKNMNSQVEVVDQTMLGITNIVQFRQSLNYDVVEGTNYTVAELIVAPWNNPFYNVALRNQLAQDLPDSFANLVAPISIPFIVDLGVSDNNSDSSDNTTTTTNDGSVSSNESEKESGGNPERYYALIVLALIPIVAIGYLFYRKRSREYNEKSKATIPMPGNNGSFYETGMDQSFSGGQETAPPRQESEQVARRKTQVAFLVEERPVTAAQQRRGGGAYLPTNKDQARSVIGPFGPQRNITAAEARRRSTLYAEAVFPEEEEDAPSTNPSTYYDAPSANYPAYGSSRQLGGGHLPSNKDQARSAAAPAGRNDTASAPSLSSTPQRTTEPNERTRVVQAVNNNSNYVPSVKDQCRSIRVVQHVGDDEAPPPLAAAMIIDSEHFGEEQQNES